MKYSDEILMAYADGELDAATRAGIEAAVASDPELAASVSRHRAMRERMRRGFEPILQEPVPHRLLDALAPQASSPASVDVRPRPPRGQATVTRPARPWSWPHWAALAATLVVGALIGAGLRHAPAPLMETRHDGLVAAGELSRALSTRLASDVDPAAVIRPGLSFQSTDGNYCRTFVAGRVAGLACRDPGRWRIELLSTLPEAATGTYRPAGGLLPPVILEAIEARIDGDPLDAEGEAAARERGWRD
jgi:anti-sigma factor RsiW